MSRMAWLDGDNTYLEGTIRRFQRIQNLAAVSLPLQELINCFTKQQSDIFCIVLHGAHSKFCTFQQ